jgi:DNA/RNA-binding protein KIN17
MNATKWSTLTDFVQYLGKIGKCVVEETERGWYVTYIERDPTILAQQENYKRRVEAEKKEEKKFAKRMEQQRVEAAILMDKAGIGLKVEASALKREISDAPIAMSLGGGNDKKKKSQTKVKKSVFGDDDESDGDENIQKEAVSQKESLSRAVRKEVEESIRISDAKASKKRKRSEDLTPNELQKEENIKEKEQHNDQGSKDQYGKEKWIRKDILVRIISKKVAKGKYYKRKGVINRVYDKFTAEVEILDSAPGKRDGGKILEIDQDRLETVVPKEGKKVMLLSGKNRGFLAELLSADKEKYRATLKMLDDGKVLKKVDFEDFSKYNP